MTDTISEPKAALTVYKASAGSGKTFTLALEYIKLLLEDPRAYEGILAVTFTNKATEEMKMRILSTLYGLSQQLPDSKDYMTKLMEQTALPAEEIARRSDAALHNLLHNYHFFKVQTIDTFFQGVLRNLAHELQLNANLRVGLNNTQVVSQAVDVIIDSLADDMQLRQLVKNYMEESLADNKTWNVIGNIKKFGKNIFKEIYKKNREKMNTAFAADDFFPRFKNELHTMITEKREFYVSKAKEVLEMIEDSGLIIKDFCRGASGPMGYFIKLADGKFDKQEKDVINKTFLNALENPTAWYTKKSDKADAINQIATECLIPMAKALEKTRTKDAILARSARETLRHISNVQLLRRIEEAAHSLNDASQRFMLSDTQTFLHEMIGEDDAPFIYEKIGTRLKHIMIDEFQDTSTVQWLNFKTLLDDCIGNGTSNLIVGDVKQSIYRFRSGDWRLLNNIDGMFRPEQIRLEPMVTNWRSTENVINFNNTFLSLVAKMEADEISNISLEKGQDIEKAYSDVKQEVPPHHKGSGGLVYMEMLPKDDIKDVPAHTLSIINDLLESGASQNDIAILVRNKKEIPLMANYIEKETQGKVRIISAEAFRLDASAEVRIIVNALKLLVSPSNRVALATLIKDYYAGIKGCEDVGSEIFASGKELMEWLPEEFTEKRHALTAMTLQDTIEEIMHIFCISGRKTGSAYVTTFLDAMRSFSNEMAPTISDFLEAWETDIAEKTIETTGSDGVKILTIHKSKGLEFDHVIMPYCQWSNKNTDVIWVEPRLEPFSKLPLVPVDFRAMSSLEETIYRTDGHEEHIQRTMDDLNLLYVAMTRAVRSLFMLGQRDASTATRSKTICQAIAALPQEICGLPVHIANAQADTLPLTVTYGVLTVKEKKASCEAKSEAENGAKCGVKCGAPARENPFTMGSEPVDVCVSTHHNSSVLFRQSNDSRRFADDSIDDDDAQRYIRIGTIMHQIFSTIRTLKDVEPALLRMEFDGTLYDDTLTREKLLTELRSKFSNATVREWFSERWRVYNECSILTPEGVQRPDRVITDGNITIVIDFKFGKKNADYHNQVKNYMQLLSDMGHKNVQGFLWYVTLNDIEQVYPWS